MMRRADRKPYPILGYFILNLLVLVVLFGIYEASLAYAAHNKVVNAGLFPVLAVCFFAFLVVSALDAAFDRLTGRRSAALEKPVVQAERTSGSASREASKRPD